MTEYKSDFVRAIVERGFLHQCTDLEALDEHATHQRVIAYIGFDCTASSLHVGNLVVVLMLRWLQQTGHKPIVLMGGGTTKVGDPSGKDESRKMLSVDKINANMDSIKQIFSKYLTFGDGPTDAVMVNNADWLDKLQYIDFLRDYGAHFTINRMLSFDSVKSRLEREQPLTFLEFNYMILQAYDFLELARRQDCIMQMGASDQWGNIVNGIELCRRVDGRSLFGLTAPLITLSSGAKMGKSADGAVWLNGAQLSPYKFWQFWRNTEDADVGRFLRLFTALPLVEIQRLESLEGAEINDAKKILADEATRMCHGAEAAKAARETSETTFENGGLGDDLPTIEFPKAKIDDGVPAFELIRAAELASSNGAARRLIKGGGARINDKVVADETHAVTTSDINEQGVIKVSAGKKRHVLVRPV